MSAETLDRARHRAVLLLVLFLEVNAQAVERPILCFRREDGFRGGERLLCAMAELFDFSRARTEGLCGCLPIKFWTGQPSLDCGGRIVANAGPRKFWNSQWVARRSATTAALLSEL
jgi:hypothetical protein